MFKVVQDSSCDVSSSANYGGGGAVSGNAPTINVSAPSGFTLSNPYVKIGLSLLAASLLFPILLKNKK